MHALMRSAAGFDTACCTEIAEQPGMEPVASAITRRAVLVAGGAAGFVLGFGFLAPKSARAAAPGVDGAAQGPLAPNAFVRVGSDNLITVVCKHHEMGQGNTTGLASLVAEELDADWSLVRTEYAPADEKRYGNLAFGGAQGTGGSSAIANSYMQYRTAGATARAMLVAAAAQSWQVPAAEIKTYSSTLSHASGRRATYGEMAATAAKQAAPAAPALKDPSQFRFIGKDHSAPRVDSPSKCNGTAVYTIDVKLPGLLTAVIAWPPSFGAKLMSFDPADAKKVAGVTDVVQVPEGVAVVAKGMWAALEGRRALKAVWDESESQALDTEALFGQYRGKAGEHGASFTVAPAPAATNASERPAKTVEGVYEFPFLAHAAMEPMNCVAWLHDGQLETWGGHQFPSIDRPMAAKAAGLSPDKVTLHTLVSGGSFGRRANPYADFTVAAVNVAKAIGGRAPVRLQYTREDDMSAGLYRPLFVHAVTASIDANGAIASWKHVIVGQSITAGTPFASKDGIDPASVEGVSPTIYHLPMLDGQLHSPLLAVRPLWWRSVGNTHTAFVMETMIDELAAAAGKDPVAFRFELFKGGDEKSARADAVLKLLVAKGGWGATQRKGVAQGIAVHESFGSVIGQLVEVSLPNGKVKVERVVCVVDCGVAVNPDIVRAQMEGGIGYALSALYYSEVDIKQGRPMQRNFDTYRSLRIEEMPRIDVHILPSKALPSGVGEPGVPPLAPAVANAIAKLTGRRVRRLPLTRAGLISA